MDDRRRGMGDPVNSQQSAKIAFTHPMIRDCFHRQNGFMNDWNRTEWRSPKIV